MILKNLLLSNVGISLLGKGLTACIQLLSLMLLIRGLTTEEFGIYAIINAINLFALHWMNPGITNMIVQFVAQSLPINYRTETFRIFQFGIVGFVMMWALSMAFFQNIDIKVLLLSFLSDVFLDRVIDVYIAKLQGKSNFKQILKWDIIRVFSKFAIITALFFMDNLQIYYVFTGYVALNLVLAAFVYIKLWSISEQNGTLFDRKMGRSFAASISFKSGYQNTDKLMIERLVNLESVGYYSGAQKILNLVYLPLQAFMAVQYPLFFKLGKLGRAHVLAHARRISFYIVPIFVFVSTLLYVTSDQLSLMLSGELILSEYIEVMSGMPVVIVLNTLLGDALTGLGEQNARAKFQGVVFLFNVIANFILLGALGVKGAIIATYLSELVLFLMYLIKVRKID